MQLIVQPCSDADAQRHFESSVATKVPVSRILPFLDPAAQAAVANTFGTGVAVWGVTPGKGDVNVGKWSRVAVGDLALFYRSLRFFHMGTVAYKVHSPDLALDIWGKNGDGNTWEYVYFLTDLEAVDISVERFNAAMDYSPGNIVRGFNVLPESKYEAALDVLELDAGLGPSLPASQDVTLARRALQELEGILDLPATTRRRREQAYLRRILLSGRNAAACSICARVVPVDLLVIGHIRKRHSCDAGQKRDLSNVMPVCLLGCDVLFEKGYVFVDARGIIRSARDGLSSALNSYLAPLRGKSCGAWSAAAEPYFAWHRDNVCDTREETATLSA